MKRWLIAVFLILYASTALAQQPAQPDPRLAGPTIQAQAALLSLREAEMRAMQEDWQKRLAEREQAWADYSGPLWKAPEPTETPTPEK